MGSLSSATTPGNTTNTDMPNMDISTISPPISSSSSSSSSIYHDFDEDDHSDVAAAFSTDEGQEKETDYETTRSAMPAKAVSMTQREEEEVSSPFGDASELSSDEDDEKRSRAKRCGGRRLKNGAKRSRFKGGYGQLSGTMCPSQVTCLKISQVLSPSTYVCSSANPQ